MNYWLSTERMTVGVEVVNGKIKTCPPIVQKFIGQPVENLISWMKRQPGFIMEILDEPGSRN
jgi:hypothetical protein